LLDKNDILERKNKMKKFFFNRKILHILTVLTIMSIFVKTTICVHDLKDDVHVSKYKIRDFESNKNKGSRIEKKNRVK